MSLCANTHKDPIASMTSSRTARARPQHPHLINGRSKVKVLVVLCQHQKTLHTEDLAGIYLLIVQLFPPVLVI
jgi:hypothetical protein